MTQRMDKRDRCDRCGSEAFFMAMKDDLHPLLFCVHHGRLYAPRLIHTGWDLLDESERIQSQESTASANA